MNASEVRFNLFDIFHFEYRKLKSNQPAHKHTNNQGSQPSANSAEQIVDLYPNAKSWSMKDSSKLFSLPGSKSHTEHGFCYNPPGFRPSCTCTHFETGKIINIYV